MLKKRMEQESRMGGTTVGGDGRHGVLSLRMADLAPFLNVLCVLFKADLLSSVCPRYLKLSTVLTVSLLIRIFLFG